MGRLISHLNSIQLIHSISTVSRIKSIQGTQPPSQCQSVQCESVRLSGSFAARPSRVSADAVCLSLGRSHPLCGTLRLRGPDRGRPQLQERGEVSDYQQHVSTVTVLITPTAPRWNGSIFYMSIRMHITITVAVWLSR